MIVDLTVPRDALDATGASGHISAAWPGAPAGVGTVRSPWTAYDTSGGRFLPRSTPTVIGGAVDLRATTTVVETDPSGYGLIVDQPDWVVTTIDVDAAVARLSDAKASIDADAHDSPATLPALRTVGLMLMHRGRGALLATPRHGPGPSGASRRVAGERSLDRRRPRARLPARRQARR